MIIIGAKGFAKEVLEVLHELNQLENLVFYDDVNVDIQDELFGQFKVLKSLEAAKSHFEKVDNRFTIGIGNPVWRKSLNDKFTELGGVFTSTISPFAYQGGTNGSTTTNYFTTTISNGMTVSGEWIQIKTPVAYVSPALMSPVAKYIILVLVG
jgi:hypothetical protein